MPNPLDFLKNFKLPGFDSSVPEMSPEDRAKADAVTTEQQSHDPGWMQAGRSAIDGLVGFAKGALGIGDQGPSGATATNFGQLLAAGLPMFHAGLPGMYSRVERTAEALPEALHPVKAEGIFKNNAAKEEIDYRGLGDFLKGNQTPKVTKAAIQEHLAANPMPEIGVKDFGGPRSAPEPDGAGGLVYREGNQPTKYERPSLNVPGGENYQERLLTLPTEPAQLDDPKAFDKWHYNFYGQHPQPEDYTDPQSIRAYYANRRNFDATTHPPVEPYKSGHWEEPNVLAHSRFDERYLPADPNDPMLQGYPADYAAKVGGEKGRFIQEVQSDWHQAGKEKGYSSGDTSNEAFKDWLVRHNYATEPYAAQIAAGLTDDNHLRAQFEDMRAGVPDAPFKDTWPDLVLKQHVLDVADKPDLNWLGFTTGDTQNARYDLAQHVRNMDYNPDLGQLDLELLNGDRRAIHAPPEDLHLHVGRDMARRIMENPNSVIPDEAAAPLEATGNWHTVNLNADEPLTVGGAGMRHFYDQKLPSALGKILKPFGGKVELGEIPGPQPKLEIRPRARALEQAGEEPVNGWEAQIWNQANGGEHIASAIPLHRDPVSVTDYEGQQYRGDAMDRLVQKGAPVAADVMRTNPSLNKGVPAWIAHLTPEMKKAILEKGLPLLTLFGLGQLPPTTTPDPLKGLKDAR